METISSLPQKNPVIGTKVVVKNIRKGSIKNVVVAKNCPKELIEKVHSSGVVVRQFVGDEGELGTKVGKPFPVAMVGYLDSV
jgi:large subunit ribosomal protein L30e